MLRLIKTRNFLSKVRDLSKCNCIFLYLKIIIKQIIYSNKIRTKSRKKKLIVIKQIRIMKTNFLIDLFQIDDFIQPVSKIFYTISISQNERHAFDKVLYSRYSTHVKIERRLTEYFLKLTPKLVLNDALTEFHE